MELTHATEKDLASTEYHRIGSDIYWQFERNYQADIATVHKLFKQTALKDYIKPVAFSEAMRRFAEYCCKCHGDLFGENVKYFSKKDKLDPNRWYLSFYTGKIDSEGKSRSDYFEVARIVLSAEYESNQFVDYDVVILEKAQEWLVRSNLESRNIIDDCFLLTESNLTKACADYCNERGYRYSDRGGYYFLSHQNTDDLYEIKKILDGLGLYFAIKPVIAGKTEDVEDILRLIGSDFREILLESELRLFQSCLFILSKQSEWENFKILATAKNPEYKNTYISKTRYGKILVDKIDKLIMNAGQVEYAKLINELLGTIAPDKNASYKRLLSTRDSLQSAIDKIRQLSSSPLIERHYNRLLGNIADTNKTIEFLGKHIQNETLSLEF
jgi:hypothetical protein